MDCWKRFVLPFLFAAGGAAAGFGYYYFFGCTTGCPITSSPVRSMLYMSVVGWLLYNVFRKDRTSCNI